MQRLCSPEFLTSGNTDSKKNVSFEYSEIAGSLPEKILKKAYLVAFLLKIARCSIHPPITMPKTDSTASVPFVCSKKF